MQNHSILAKNMANHGILAKSRHFMKIAVFVFFCDFLLSLITYSMKYFNTETEH